MNRIIIGTVFACFGLAMAACGSDTSSSSSSSNGEAGSEVVLDVRCSADSDCPSGFECEDEVEHGVDQSYCVSHDEDAADAGECPAGYELEEEHDGTFCKPHGGEDGEDGAGGDDSGGHGDDDDGDDHGGGEGGDDDAAGTGGDDHGGGEGGDDAGAEDEPDDA